MKINIRQNHIILQANTKLPNLLQAYLEFQISKMMQNFILQQDNSKQSDFQSMFMSFEQDFHCIFK